MMTTDETEYGPGRTIPHPILFRVLDSEAEDTTVPEIKVEQKSEFAYYPGCVDYYDMEMQFSHVNYGETNHGIIFDSSIKLLRAVGIEPMILDRSFMKCCGHDQLWQGKVDVFETMRDYNTKIIQMLGVKTLVTSCAEGYRTFKLDYGLEKQGIRVVHITQILYERGLRVPPQGENAKKIRVAYQDPCRSCRQMPVDPVYEEPRELIKRVDNAELVERAADLARVAQTARKTAASLQSWLDRGFDIVAPVPSCALMMKFEWPLIVPDDENVQRLSKATRDISEYVVAIAKKEGLVDGLKPLPGGVTIHLACHARAQNMGPKAAEMLKPHGFVLDFVGIFDKLEKRIGDARPLNALLRAELGKKMELENKDKLEVVAKDLKAEGFRTSLKLDEEHNLYVLSFWSETLTERTIDWELLSSADYKRLLDLHRRVRTYDKPPFVISTNGSQLSIEDRKELLDHVMALGKKSFTVQRFKGLGEMNPSQLWETTMDAEKRILLQVHVEDQVAADDIFTVLMGDQVEPRRQFIQDNALDVKNLDI